MGLKNKKGFSLTETLVAVLMSSLLTVLVASATAVGTTAYFEVTEKTQAQTLLTDYFTELRTALKTAASDTYMASVATKAGTVYHHVFYSDYYNSYGTFVPYEYESGMQIITFMPLVNTGNGWSEMERRYVISTRSSIAGFFITKEITTEFTNFTYSNGVFSAHIALKDMDKDEVLTESDLIVRTADKLVEVN